MSKVIRLSDEMLSKLSAIKNEIVEKEEDPITRHIFKEWEEKDIIGYLVAYYNIGKESNYDVL